LEEKYRAGIIGCGGIAWSHARAYQEYGKVNLVAAADISPEALEKFADQFSVSTKYADYKEMLKKEDLDLVSVCTWQGTHAEITIAAAERGVKGILCEKPMAVNLGEADAMIEACDRSGTKLVVCHQHRFDAINMEARKLLQEGVIGQPTMIFRRTRDGLLNSGTHAIDGVRYILSDPETEWVIGQVERRTDRYERRCRIEDLCMGLICFSGGTRFVIESDMPGPELSAPLIYGTEGMLTASDGRLLLLNDKELGWQEIKPPEEGTTQLAELIAWIEGRIQEHRGSGRQARYTMEIMMAIYESLRIKGLVRMPLKTKESPLEMMINYGTLPVEKPGKYDIRVPF